MSTMQSDGSEHCVEQGQVVRGHIARMKHYQYEPLLTEQIRILELQPGRFGEPLHACIRRVKLSSTLDDDNLKLDVDPVDIDEMPQGDQYDAISYVWGSGDKPHEILIESGGCLSITTSLYQALQRLRLEICGRNLWADALCINQSDDNEKSTQVGLMGRIYRAAFHVVVWLGESEGLDNLAYALLGAYNARMFTVLTKAAWQDIACEIERFEHCCSCCPSTSFQSSTQALEAAFRGVSSLMSRRWFGRLWVVQEALLTNTLLFQSGTHKVRSEDLAGLGFYKDNEESLQPLISREITENTGRTWAPIRKLFSDMFPHISVLRRRTFLDCLLSLGNRECSHPLDRIYAVRDVSCIGAWPELAPDYRKSPLEVFTQLTVLCIERDTRAVVYNFHGGNVHPSALLAIAPRTHSRAQGEAWPSWVPDFHQLLTSNFLNMGRIFPASPEVISNVEHWPFSPYALFCDTGDSVERSEIQTLSLGGRVLGNVRSILLDSQLAAVPGCHTLADPIEGDELQYSQDWTVLIEWAKRCGAFVEEHQPHEWELQDARPNPQPEIHLLIELMRDISKNPEGGREFDNFSRHLSTLTETRRPLLSFDKCLAAVQIHGSTLMGWVADGCQPGDNICILFGAPQAFIIRERWGSYQVIGDIYIDGLTEEDAILPDTEMLSWVRKRTQFHRQFQASVLSEEELALAFDELDPKRPPNEWISIC